MFGKGNWTPISPVIFYIWGASHLSWLAKVFLTNWYVSSPRETCCDQWVWAEKWVQATKWVLDPCTRPQGTDGTYCSNCERGFSTFLHFTTSLWIFIFSWSTCSTWNVKSCWWHEDGWPTFWVTWMARISLA